MKNAKDEVKQINLQLEDERIAISAEYKAKIAEENERFLCEESRLRESFHCEMANAKYEHKRQRAVIESRLRELKQERFLEAVGVEEPELLKSIINKYESLRSEQKDLLCCLEQSFERQRQLIFAKSHKSHEENRQIHSECIANIHQERDGKLKVAKDNRRMMIDNVIKKYGNAE